MLLEVSNLTKRRKEFCLEGISLQIEEGCALGLVGANGAGKTTLIKCIMGLCHADEGAVSLFGQPMGKQLPLETKQQIGVVLDSCSFPKEYNVADVNAVMRSAWSQWDQQAFTRYITAFGMNEKHRVKELSRGMGMKLSLACALSHAPRLLLLDEATAGLDPLARDEIVALLREYLDENGAGMLLASHITTDLEHCADQVMCLDAGNQVFLEDKEAITDLAGIARCAAEDVDALAESGLFAAGQLRVERRAYNVNVLVPNRFDFARAFPEIACDRATLEDYMRLTMKGEKR